MKVELTRFKVKNGMSACVDGWMELLNDRLDEVLLTLNDEKMYVETIFRETIGEDEFLYWYSIQGEGGSDVSDSENEIDKKHLEFWKKCIDDTYKPVNLPTEVVMIPDYVRNSMK